MHILVYSKYSNLWRL